MCISPLRRPSSAVGPSTPPESSANCSGTSRSTSANGCNRSVRRSQGPSPGCDSVASKNLASASRYHEYASPSFGTKACMTASVAALLPPVRYSTVPTSGGALRKLVRVLSARPSSTSGFSPGSIRRNVFAIATSSNVIEVFDCSARSTCTETSLRPAIERSTEL